jgi:hypothetical protein
MSKKPKKYAIKYGHIYLAENHKTERFTEDIAKAKIFSSSSHARRGMRAYIVKSGWCHCVIWNVLENREAIGGL